MSETRNAVKVVHKYVKGSRAETVVTDAAGNLIPGVQSVVFSHAVDGQPTLTLTLIGAQIEYEGPVTSVAAVAPAADWKVGPVEAVWDRGRSSVSAAPAGEVFIPADTDRLA